MLSNSLPEGPILSSALRTSVPAISCEVSHGGSGGPFFRRRRRRHRLCDRPILRRTGLVHVAAALIVACAAVVAWALVARFGASAWGGADALDTRVGGDLAADGRFVVERQCRARSCSSSRRSRSPRFRGRWDRSGRSGRLGRGADGACARRSLRCARRGSWRGERGGCLLVVMVVSAAVMGERGARYGSASASAPMTVSSLNLITAFLLVRPRGASW